MANFPALKMTAAGRVLQAKAQTGQELKFSRVGLGDGTLAGSLDALLALVAEKKSLSIRDHKATGDGTSILQVIATNEGLASGFYIREVGLFALDPDTGEELLYSYTNAGAESDFLPGAGGAITYEGLFDLITVVGNAENVTAVIDDYITIALKSEVEALRPYILPTGGTVGQMARKKSNAEGDVEWFDPALSGLDVRLKSIEEPRSAVANQRTFTLQKTITNGLAVYVGSVDASGAPSKTVARLPREAWTALSATQVQLADPLAAKTPVVFVNNEEAGPGESLSVSIEGPTLVYPGSTNTFTIGAFDSFSVYTQTATKGTLTRSGKTLTLVLASGEAAGTLDLTVTRDSVAVTRRVAIGAAAIEKPQIVSPAQGATGVGFEPDLSIAPFVVYPAGYDTLRKTRWQVALDAAFTQFVYNAESTTNLTSINLGAVGVRLEPSKQYFVRAQEVGDTLTSAWADGVSFNTAAVYIRRPSLLNPIDGQIGVSSAVVFEGDAFSVYGGADTHLATRLQYSYVADFSTVAYDSGFQTAQLTKITPPSSLPLKTEIFVRLKYRGKNLGDSEWSPVVRFVTSDRLKGTYTQLSTGPAARMNAVSVALNGKVYLSGGRVAASAGAPFSDIWEYDIATSTWKQKSIGQTQSDHTAVVIGNLIYFYGGTTSSGGSASITKVSVYDPVANTIVQKSAGPGGARVGHVAGAIDGKMYIFGGTGGRSPTLIRYTPGTDTWETLAEPPAIQSSLYAEGAVAGGRLYILGGGKLYCYNPGTNTWTTKAAFPGRAIAGTTIFGIDNLLYVWGGYYNSSYTYSLNDLYSYDFDTDKWTALTSGGHKTYYPASAVYGGAAYVFGGAQGDAPGYGGGWAEHYKIQ